MSRLCASHLAKSYGRRRIVTDLSLEVGAGEVDERVVGREVPQDGVASSHGLCERAAAADAEPQIRDNLAGAAAA